MGGIFVKPYPSDTVFARHDTVFCNAAAGTTVLQSPFAGFYQVWDDGSTNIQRAITGSGTYWVRNGDYCHFRIDTFVAIVENIAPIITVNGFELGTTLPYSNYQWLFEGNIIPGAVNSTYTVTENGNYSVIAGNSNCTDTSNTYLVSNVTGIDNISSLSRQINIYPNPASDIIHINAPFPVQVSINSIEGKVLHTAEKTNTVTLSTLSRGVYFLHIRDKNGMLLKVEKIVKQ